MLLLAALIWGCAFVAQSKGTEYVGPWTFNCLRSLIGGLTLLVLMPFLDRVRKTKADKEQKNSLLTAGIACGIVLAAGSMFQQLGIMQTTTGKAGFITALYVILVPILAIFLGRKTRLIVWLAACIALAGFYFLSFAGESWILQEGDLYLLICAVLFAVHILVIDHFSFVDGVRMSCLQFFVAGVICMVGMFLFEKPDMHAILDAVLPILYAGCLSSGAGYTLQIVGQKDADPTVASMLLSLESVFAALSGFVLLNQRMAMHEIFGCILIFIAVIAAQYPEKKKKEVSL
jgi:Permeases of the drug/metabolite transporter (DMT) superfamily